MGRDHDQRGDRPARQPGVINSDQGRQFTSEACMPLFRKGGAAEGVLISMDGKGRAIDNVFIERFWRTLKHGYLYLSPPVDGIALHQSCARFIERYNNQRKHSSLSYRTPAACFRAVA